MHFRTSAQISLCSSFSLTSKASLGMVKIVKMAAVTIEPIVTHVKKGQSFDCTVANSILIFNSHL